MQVTKENTTPTTIKLTIVADQAQLEDIKKEVLTHLRRDHVKIAGFRPGKAPLNLVEKSVDPNLLQSEFLESAVNRLYVEAITEQKVRPVAQPQVSIKKFVPFTTLEIEAEVEAVGDITLPDYKKIKLARKPVKVEDKDVDEVIDNLKERAATKKEVERAAKLGDEVTIDFAGRDAKTNEPIEGADGKEYPLVLGSGNFIPGFEDEVVGLKAGDEKEFTITFPKDYGVKDLQSKKVIFKVTADKVQALTPPKIDDEFASSVGPFKTVDELKTDIKKQLEVERQNQADRDYESELLEKIAEKTEMAVPAALVDEELDRMEQQERQNVAYRGQTWKEHLEAEGVTEEEHREKNRAGAELRVKAGLILAEIAEQEDVKVTPEELEVQVQLYKGQFGSDQAMQAELDKPENRRDIASRIMTQKTIQKLTSYATADGDKPKKPAAKTTKK